MASNLTLLQQVIRDCGNMNTVATYCGVTLEGVRYWRKNNKIPAEHVVKVCELAQWAWHPHQLRPDVFSHPEDGLPEPLRRRVRRENEAAAQAPESIDTAAA